MAETDVPVATDEPIRHAAAATNARPPARDAGYGSRSWLKIAVEVVLISAGVFLGLMGEQWRENAERRELAADLYHESVNYFEPALLNMYDTLLPRLDQALGETAALATGTK